MSGKANNATEDKWSDMVRSLDMFTDDFMPERPADPIPETEDLFSDNDSQGCNAKAGPVTAKYS